ncbi:MAG: copper-binding protein [Burkholderiales bacterium]
MKQSVALSLVLALSLAIPAVNHAQSGGTQSMEMDKKPAAGARTAHKATGVVKKVDPKASSVTLAHDPVKSLNWPAMTMGFQVKDKTLLDKLQAGKKVEFEFVQQGKDYVITTVN